MTTVLLVVHIMAAFSMIVLILLQRSEGGALGMGGGGGGFVTGRAAANFLTKITAGLAAIFFVTSLSLGVLSHRRGANLGRWRRHANRARPGSCSGRSRAGEASRHYASQAESAKRACSGTPLRPRSFRSRNRPGPAKHVASRAPD